MKKIWFHRKQLTNLYEPLTLYEDHNKAMLNTIISDNMRVDHNKMIPPKPPLESSMES